MTRLCQEFHVLPNAGGLLDQDSYHIWLMANVIEADREKEAQEDKRNKIQGNHPH